MAIAAAARAAAGTLVGAGGSVASVGGNDSNTVLLTSITMSDDRVASYAKIMYDLGSIQYRSATKAAMAVAATSPGDVSIAARIAPGRDDFVVSSTTPTFVDAPSPTAAAAAAAEIDSYSRAVEAFQLCLDALKRLRLRKQQQQQQQDGDASRWCRCLALLESDVLYRLSKCHAGMGDPESSLECLREALVEVDDEHDESDKNDVSSCAHSDNTEDCDDRDSCSRRCCCLGDYFSRSSSCFCSRTSRRTLLAIDVWTEIGNAQTSLGFDDDAESAFDEASLTVLRLMVRLRRSSPSTAVPTASLSSRLSTTSGEGSAHHPQRRRQDRGNRKRKHSERSSDHGLSYSRLSRRVVENEPYDLTRRMADIARSRGNRLETSRDLNEAVAPYVAGIVAASNVDDVEADERLCAASSSSSTCVEQDKRSVGRNSATEAAAAA